MLKNWCRRRGGYLWIKFDKIWFWGVLIRKTANRFDGLNPEAVREYHKFHISNTVGIAVVGVDFEDISNNGVRSIKLIFQRVQSSKVIHRNLVGKNGVIIKIK